MDTCPNCGYCKHCGRGGHQVYPVYPIYPQWTGPWWGIYPPNWTGHVVTTPGTTTVTAGTNGDAVAGNTTNNLGSNISFTH